MATLGSLPEEILAQIISYLDTTPLTISKARYVPTLDLFDGPAPLKDLSCCSKQFRRLILPQLFKFARLNLSAVFTLNAEIADGDSPVSISTKLDQMFDAFYSLFLAFLERESLLKDLSSLLVVLNDFNTPFTQMKGIEKHLATRIASMWQKLFAVLDPSRVVLLGPIFELGWLAGCKNPYMLLKTTLNTGCQILELDRTHPPAHFTNPQKADYGLSTKAHGGYQLSPSSVLHIRRWSHIGLNEGSYLHIYSTDEWLERGESTDNIPSLIDYIFPQCCGQSATAHAHRFLYKINAMSFLDSFAYTAVFPPYNHGLDIEGMVGMHRLHYLRKLDVQLAPHPDQMSKILHDDQAVDRADLSECWGSVQQTYCKLQTLLKKSLKIDDWRLRTIVCQDAAIESFDRDMTALFEARHRIALPWDVAWGRMWKVVDTDDGRILTAT